MIRYGLMLALIGVPIVFLFLTILWVMTALLSRAIAAWAPLAPDDDAPSIAAAIAAAYHQSKSR